MGTRPSLGPQQNINVRKAHVDNSKNDKDKDEDDGSEAKRSSKGIFSNRSARLIRRPLLKQKVASPPSSTTHDTKQRNAIYRSSDTVQREYVPV